MNVRPVSTPASTTTRLPTWRFAALPLWAVAAVLVFRFYWVVNKFAVNLFFFDEWDIYDGLFRKWPWWRFFLQEHGPHRQGIGVTVVVWLLRASHWDSRIQVYAIATVIVLAMFLAVRVKARVFGTLGFFDVIIPILFLGLGQWEVLLSAPGPSPHAFPLLLLLSYCLAWIQEKVWLRYTAVTLINFLLIYTGYGIFASPITLVLLGIDAWQRWRNGKSAMAPLSAWIASAASLASFFSGYVFSPAADCYQFPYHNPAAYLWFMGLMFSKFLGIKHGSVLPAVLGIGVVIVLVAVALRSFLLLVRHMQPATCMMAILAGYSLIYAAAAAVGRVCMGMDAAGSSRNLTLLIPGFLAIYFFLLGLGHGQKRTLLITVFLLAVLPSSIQRDHREIEGFSAMKHAWKTCYLSNENIRYCDAVSGLQLYPRPDVTHLHEKLNFLKENHLNLYANGD